MIHYYLFYVNFSGLSFIDWDSDHEDNDDEYYYDDE